MFSSQFSQFVICPIRFSLVAVFATLLATFNPIATDASVLGGEAVSRMFFDDVLLGRDVSAVQGLVAPGALLTTPEGVYEGELGALAYLDDLSTSFAQVEFRATDYMVGDETVAVQFTMSGFHTGPYLGLPGKCAEVAVDGIAILTIGDEGISDQVFTYDRQSLVAQIVAMDGLDQHTRPLCDITPVLLETPEPVPAALPPSCIAANVCRTAF